MKWKSYNKRKKIGILIHQYQNEIWDSLIKRADELNIDLYFFVGRSLNSPYDTEIPQNYIYEIPTDLKLDGLLICSGTLANFCTREEFLAFLKNYENIPFVSLFLKVENAPSIMIDNKKGIKKIMQHLVEKHNYKKFAFIKGPYNSPDALERYEGFCEYIKEKGLKIKEQIFINGDFRFESGIEAVKNIGKKIEEIDAIVCANDNMAIGVINQLNEMKSKKFPAITGFDNIISSEGVIPPLTTIDINLREATKKSLDILVDLIDGKDVEEIIFISPELIVRESCGCNNRIEINKQILTQDIKLSYENEDKIIELIENEKITISQLVNKAKSYKDITESLNFIEKILAKLKQKEKNRLNNFYNEILMLRIITRDISCDITIEDLKKHLIEKLHLVEIKNFYLFLFENIEADNSYKKENLKLELSLEESTPIEKKVGSEIKEIINTIPEGKHYILLPLSGKNEIYGVIILNYIPNDIIYEILREQLSSTLKYINVFQKKIQTEIELEKTLETLKQLNEKYFSMLEYLPSAIFEINNDFSIEFENKNAKELLILNENEKNLNFIDFVFPDDRNRFHKIFENIKEGKEFPELNEIRLIKRNGSIVHFLFNIVPIYEESFITIKGLRISGFDIRPILSKSLSIDEEFFKEFSLSPREKEVLKLWMQGYQIKEIASSLFIAESTVKIHIGSIYSKLDVKNKTEFFEFLKNYQIKKFGYESFLFSILSQIIKN